MSGGLDLRQLIALTISVVACLYDVRLRRIPNVLSLGGALAAFACLGVTQGGWALGNSIAGWLVGLAIFLPLFLLRGLGAGDVKLLACIGAWLGPALVLRAGLYGAIAGGAMALLVALSTGYLRTAVDNLYVLLSHFRVMGIRPHPELTLERGTGPRLPYALPIAAGTLAALWLN